MAPLDPTTAERLVQLRLLHQRAVAAASDSTPAGQHGAIIALDGVCEQALLLAAAHLALEIKKNGVLDVHAAVAGELGTKWQRPGAKAVHELHRSRNNAQHHGILPAPEHLPRWISEIDRYLGSLVRATFGVVLDDVRVASAVADERLREELVAAEAALDDDEFGVAVKTAARALSAARENFRRHRGASTFRPPVTAGFREIDDMAKTLRAVDDFIDVAHFAADPSDALWLAELVAGMRRSEQDPTPQEAQRALSFVLSWVLRWEAYEARRPIVDDAWADQEPSLDEAYEKPGVSGLTVSPDPAVPGGTEFRVELREIPPGWLMEVSNAQRVLRDAGEANGLVFAQWKGRGALVLVVETGLGADAVRQLLDLVVDTTHRCHTDRIEARRAARDAVFAAALAYREALSKHGGEGHVLEVGPVEEPWREPDETWVKLTLREPAAGLMWRDLAAAFSEIAAADGHAQARLAYDPEPGCIRVDPACTPPDRVDAWLAAAVAAITRQTADARQVKAHRDESLQALQNQVRALVLDGADGGMSPRRG